MGNPLVRSTIDSTRFSVFSHSPVRATAGNPAFVALLIVFSLYAAAFIFRVSFVADGRRYFTLADDQMISMRYAENLAAGHGLVWNAGDPPVEGYTNFAWVLYMALYHWAGVPKPIISVFIQATGALLILLTLFFVRRIAHRVSGGSSAAALSSCFLVAFYVPLVNWALQGTEVSILTLVVTMAAWLALRALESDHPPVGLYFLLGASTLVRPDMAILAAGLLTVLAALRSDMARTHILLGGLVLSGFLASQTAFRLLYFGDWLPNTYYLKLSGFPILPRLTRGFFVTMLFALRTAPAVLPLVLTGMLARPSREMKLLLAVVAVQLLYSVWVGGDSWEWWGGSNRFVSIVIPLFFVCVGIALQTIRASKPSRDSQLSRPYVFAAFLLAHVLVINYAALATKDGANPVSAMLLLTKPKQTSEDASNVRAALALRKFTTHEAVVAVVWGGAIPYFSERRSIDLLGKTDRRVAREPMHLPDANNWWTGFYPGHLKWNYTYSIGKLQPDVIQAPLWRLGYVPNQARTDTLRGYLRDRASQWYIRADSPRILWHEVAEQTKPDDPRPIHPVSFQATAAHNRP